MGRAPCCDKANVKRGPWFPEEDATLKNYFQKHGTGGNWISLPQRAGLKRCGKSCRLRWLNYLRPDIKHGAFTEEEDHIIISLYSKMGSRWSVIAANLPGRTDNDVKNHWNTKLKKKLFGGGNNNNNYNNYNNNNNNKFSPSNNTLKNNLSFTNNNSNNNITNFIFQVPQVSSSTPTPSPSPSPSPSPTYVDNNYTHDQQFYVPYPSFSNLLAQCTSNNIPMSLMPNISSNLTNLDHITYAHDPISSSNSAYYPLHQAQLTTSNPTGNAYQHEEVSSISESSTGGGVYGGGSSLEDDPFLSELGNFGLAQEVLVTPTACNYGDQDDIKPQGLGQGVTNY